MRVVKNYFYNASYQVFMLIVPLITTPYLSRVLGPTGIGINSYTNSVIQYFILFGSIGINLYGNRQIAYIRGNKRKLTQTFYEIFVLRIITIFVALLLFLVFMTLVKEYRQYYWAQAISLIATMFDISWFFMGVENFSVTVLRNLVIKIITIVCIFSLVKSNNDLTLYILILSFSTFLGNLTLFPSLRRYIGRPAVKLINVCRHFKSSIILFVPQIATQIYLVVNKTMLGSMISVQSAGYFDQSDKIIKMVLAVVTATGTVMLPHVANAFANGEYKKTLVYLYRSFSFVSALSIPMLFGLVAVSSKFVPLFFTEKFSSVTLLLMVESVVIVLIAWSNVIGTQYLLPTGQTKYYTISVVLGAIVNIVVNIPLIFLWGAVGATVATVLSELTVTLYQLYVVKKQISYRSLLQDTGKYCVAGIMMFLLVHELDTILPVSWLMLLLEVTIGIIFYVLLLFVFRVRIIGYVISFLNHK